MLKTCISPSVQVVTAGVETMLPPSSFQPAMRLPPHGLDVVRGE
jgi:hypothetical protein